MLCVFSNLELGNKLCIQKFISKECRRKNKLDSKHFVTFMKT